MSHRNNQYRQGIEDLFDRYGMSPDAVHDLVRLGHEGVPTSDEKLLKVASYLLPLVQEATHREHESALESFDTAFVPRIPQDFFEQRFTFPEPLSYDDMGNYFNPGVEV